ncbi:MAG: alkaline phosphatase D family protein [bacterium]|nr:alkaline phosphatase D family protein [bacterium]
MSDRDFDGPDTGGRALPRRDFLRTLAAAGAGGVLASLPRRTRGEETPYTASFPDGVKCGDPAPNGAVIWTRVARPADGRPVPIVWTVATDPAMNEVVRGGVAWARDAAGHMVRLQVRGLLPDRWYHYRFDGPGAASGVGRLRTAPRLGSTPDRLRYAFASCQQRSAFYVAHRGIVQENVDFLMHLGDYIYVSDGGDTTLDRYRNRWRIFHSNPLLQELHAAVPLVAMWDDGEFYNGVDRTGPPERLAFAKQAWFEHMPVAGNRHDRVYRNFRWGKLADVVMIDVRSYRDPEVPSNVSIGGIIDGQDSRIPPGPDMFDPQRTTLGARQAQWLRRTLRRSRGQATWRFVGNPYNMNPWKIQDLAGTPGATHPNEGIYVSNEAWDDYQAERRALLTYIQQQSIRNVVFTSGHTHIYLASELQPDFDDPRSPTVAFDFVTGSLTADPDPRTIAPEPILIAAEGVMRDANTPYLRYVNLLDQGYAVVDATPEETIVEFRVLDTFDANATPRTAAKFRIVNGSRVLETLFTER